MERVFKIHIAPYLLYLVYRLYMMTVRYSEPKLPYAIRKSKRYIVAHFHQDELALVNTRVGSGFLIMTSTSTDGEMMTRFLRLLGYSCIRGSSTRGGSSALLEMIKTVNSHSRNPVLAVDGPRGPIYKVKKGVILLSKRTGLPILPVSVQMSRNFCLKKSWNRLLIPKPFSRISIRFGELITVPSNADEPKMDKYAAVLERELLQLKGVKL